MAYVYKITNLCNGKIYIGFTSTTLQQRFANHCTPSARKNMVLPRAIKKYGKNNFSITPIAESSDTKRALEIEKYFIDKFNSTDPSIGYNLLGGQSHYISMEGKCLIGDFHHNSKLSKKDVIEIFMSTEKSSYLANKYNINIRTVNSIKSRRSRRQCTEGLTAPIRRASKSKNKAKIKTDKRRVAPNKGKTKLDLNDNYIRSILMDTNKTCMDKADILGIAASSVCRYIKNISGGKN